MLVGAEQTHSYVSMDGVIVLLTERTYDFKCGDEMSNYERRIIMKNKFTLIILIILFCGITGLNVIMAKESKQTENSTSLYQATVSDVEVTSIGEDKMVMIKTEEYSTGLFVTSSVCRNININNLSDLKSGQKIFFRIQSKKDFQMNAVDFLDIVELKTESKNIFTLDNYNSIIGNALYPPRLIGAVASVIFLIGIVRCLFRYKKHIN